MRKFAHRKPKGLSLSRPCAWPPQSRHFRLNAHSFHFQNASTAWHLFTFVLYRSIQQGRSGYCQTIAKGQIIIINKKSARGRVDVHVSALATCRLLIPT